jgi:sulfur carrier protein
VIVQVNGESAEVATDATVADLVQRLVASSKGVAVAVNGDIVPRSAWEETNVNGGDRVEILSAARGG